MMVVFAHRSGTAMCKNRRENHLRLRGAATWGAASWDVTHTRKQHPPSAKEGLEALFSRDGGAQTDHVALCQTAENDDLATGLRAELDKHRHEAARAQLLPETSAGGGGTVRSPAP